MRSPMVERMARSRLAVAVVVVLAAMAVTAVSAAYAVGVGPVTTLSTSPSPAGSGWVTSTGTVTFSLSATGGTLPVNSYYQIATGAVTTFTGTPVKVSTLGTTTLHFYSVDASNNVETSQVASIRIDNTKPTTTFTYAALSTTTPNTLLVGFTRKDTGSGVAQTFCSVDGVNTQTVSATGTVPVAWPVYGVVHLVGYWSVDNAGNTEAEHVAELTIFPPVLSTDLTIVPSVTSVKLGRKFTLTGVLTNGQIGDPIVVEVSKPGSGRWSYSSARLVYSVTPDGGLWYYGYTPKVKGKYRFRASFPGDDSRYDCMSDVTSVSVK